MDKKKKRTRLVAKNIDWSLFKERVKEVSGNRFLYPIADALGVDRGKFSDKCKGNNVTLGDVVTIADKYDCSIDYLLGRNDKKQLIPPADKPLLYSDCIRLFSRFFEWGLFRMDDDSKDNVHFSNEIVQYIYENIIKMRSLYLGDTITLDVYNTWLDGLCNDFQYPIISPDDVKFFDENLGNNFSPADLKNFPSLDAWKIIRQPIPELSERELLKAYANELAYYASVTKIFKVKSSEYINEIKPVVEKSNIDF